MGRYAALAAFGALCGVATSPGPAQPATPPAAPADSLLSDIVVTARKGAPRERPDAVGYYRRHCYDAVRLTGRFAPPEDDLDWDVLPAAMRAKFAIPDAAIPAFGTVDTLHGTTLIIKFERAVRPDKVVELRCTLAAIGGDHRGFVDGLSALFRGPPTQRHVGHGQGSAKVDGWQQWLWSGGPDRGSKSWHSINTGRHDGGPSWLVVVDGDFQRDHDYIIGDLKTKQGSTPVSVLTFAYFTRRPLL